jgi:hypothetical protein
MCWGLRPRFMHVSMYSTIKLHPWPAAQHFKSCDSQEKKLPW